jgi:hypothetical protein
MVVAQARGLNPGGWVLVFGAGAGPQDLAQQGDRQEAVDCKAEVSSSGQDVREVRSFGVSILRTGGRLYSGWSAGLGELGEGSVVHFVAAFSLAAPGRLTVTCKRNADTSRPNTRPFDGPWIYVQQQLILMRFDLLSGARGIAASPSRAGNMSPMLAR